MSYNVNNQKSPTEKLIDSAPLPQFPYPPRAALAAQSDGLSLIAAERRRQVEKEGWSAEHDDEHESGDLAMAAALYAAPEPLYRVKVDAQGSVKWTDPWPWWDVDLTYGAHRTRVPAWDKRATHPRLRQLVIAGALIAAEIDRLQRAAIAPEGGAA